MILGQSLSTTILGGSIKPTLDLNFLTGILDSRLVLTRASIGLYVGSNGLVQSASSGSPRFNYDPTSLASLGFLSEEARTNLVLWSDDLTQAGSWTASNITPVKTATGADGVSNSATTLTATAGNGTILQAITNSSASRAQSAWVKRRTGSGTINMTMDNGTTWTVITPTASWLPYAIPVATSANPTVGFRIVTSGDAIDVQYVQNELTGTSSLTPTNPITTNGSTATRAADVLSMTGSNFGNWYNISEGTFFVVATPSWNLDQIAILCSVNSDATHYNTLLKLNNTGLAPGKRWAGNTSNGSPTGFSVTAVDFTNATTLVGFAYAANNFLLAANHILGNFDSAGALPPAPTTFAIGSASGIQQLNGSIARIVYFPRRFSASQLQLFHL